jgi:signal transduction histidine kinase
MLVDNLTDALREIAPDEAERASRIVRGLRQTLGDVRALSRGLIPVEIDSEGLMASLSQWTRRISDLHGMRCDFGCPDPVTLDDNFTATQLFRIAQEAITNALKHGKAGNIRVHLDSRGPYINLKITDDGVGLLDVNENETGVGLRIMRYRAGQIGAHFTVRADSPRGTVVTCTLYRGSFHDGN